MVQIDDKQHQVTIVNATDPCGDETCYEYYSY